MSDSVDHEIRTLQSLYWSERDPDGLAFAPLADAFLRKGDVREAMGLLTDGTSRHPDFSTGHVIAARLYFDQGLSAEAELSARRVLELDAENIIALSILGAVLDERGDAEAGSIHAALVGADPDSDQAQAVADRIESAPDAASSAADVDAQEAEPVFAEADPGDASVDEPVLTLDELGPPPSDPVSDVVGFDVSAEAGSSDSADVDHEAPTVELLAIRPDEEGGESFEDALGLTSDVPEEEAEGDDLETALDMLGLDDGGMPEVEPAAFDALRDGGESPVMDMADLAAEAESEPAVDDALDLGALAPDDEPETAAEDVMELGALAPDEQPEPEAIADDVLDLGALAPDDEPETAAEDVMELGALAPGDEPETVIEDVLDLGALAPDDEPETVVEDVMDLGALAPDDESETIVEDVMDLGALAPDDEPETIVEDVMDLGALAPDDQPEAVAEDVLDLGALAPDDEPETVVEDVMDLGALAPDDEPEAVVEDVMDLGALAPDDEPETVVEDVMDLGALAPDDEPETVVEDVLDLGALAPDDEPEAVVEDVMDLGALAPDALAPDDDALAAAALEPADPSEEDPHVDSSEPVYTRTLAELYVSQGFTDKALDVYRQLQEADPGAEDLSTRIAELEGRPPESITGESATSDAVELDTPEAAAAAPPEEEVETLARDLAEIGTADHEVDTPFAWSEDGAPESPPAQDDGATIGGYFDSLLGWEEDAE